MSSSLWSNIFKKENSQTQQIARLWQATPLFNGIPKRQILQLTANMHVRRFQPGELIFRKGDQGAGAVLVLAGKVLIKLGKMTPVELTVGDFFGEISLAEIDKRLADAVALNDVTLVYFLKQDLEEWIELEPRLGARFLKNLASALAQRLMHANDHAGQNSEIP